MLDGKAGIFFKDLPHPSDRCRCGAGASVMECPRNIYARKMRRGSLSDGMPKKYIYKEMRFRDAAAYLEQNPINHHVIRANIQQL